MLRTQNMLVSFVNISLWENYAEEIEKAIGYSSLYELVKAGKWTYENAAKIGGIISYGFDSPLSNTALVLMAGQGVRLGFPFKADALTTAVENGKQLFTDNGILPNKILPDDSVTSPVEEFAKDGCLIMFDTVSAGMELMKKRVSGLDYFIVPLPKSDENSPYSTSVFGHSNVFGILNGCKNTAAATAALEYMALWGAYSVNEEVIDHCVPACYCDHGKQMLEIALYSVQNAEAVTSAAISYENYYEKKITDFIKHNLSKDDFKEILSEKSVDFDSYFTKLKTEVLTK